MTDLNAYKPHGYNAVSPYFIVKGAERFMDLMQRVFDAENLRIYNEPNGGIMHAEMRINDSVIMLSEATEKFEPVPMVLHVYVSDVDAVYAKALAAGCEALEDPKNSENDPDRRASFRDFAGNWWSVGTQLDV